MGWLDDAEFLHELLHPDFGELLINLLVYAILLWMIWRTWRQAIGQSAPLAFAPRLAGGSSRARSSASAVMRSAIS